MALLPAIARASVRAVVMVNERSFASMREAKRTSSSNRSSKPPPLKSRHASLMELKLPNWRRACRAASAGRHPAARMLMRAHCEMKAQLVIELLVQLSSAKERRQPRAGYAQRIHSLGEGGSQESSGLRRETIPARIFYLLNARALNSLGGEDARPGVSHWPDASAFCDIAVLFQDAHASRLAGRGTGEQP